MGKSYKPSITTKDESPTHDKQQEIKSYKPIISSNNDSTTHATTKTKNETTNCTDTANQIPGTNDEAGSRVKFKDRGKEEATNSEATPKDKTISKASIKVHSWVEDSNISDPQAKAQQNEPTRVTTELTKQDGDMGRKVGLNDAVVVSVSTVNDESTNAVQPDTGVAKLGLKDRIRSRSNSTNSQNNDTKTSETATLNATTATTTVASTLASMPAMSFVARAANILKASIASAPSLPIDGPSVPYRPSISSTPVKKEPCPPVTPSTDSGLESLSKAEDVEPKRSRSGTVVEASPSPSNFSSHFEEEGLRFASESVLHYDEVYMSEYEVSESECKVRPKSKSPVQKKNEQKTKDQKTKEQTPKQESVKQTDAPPTQQKKTEVPQHETKTETEVKLRNASDTPSTKKKTQRRIRVSSMIRSDSTSDDEPAEDAPKPHFIKKSSSRENSFHNKPAPQVSAPPAHFSEDDYSTMCETEATDAEDAYSTVTETESDTEGYTTSEVTSDSEYDRDHSDDGILENNNLNLDGDPILTALGSEDGYLKMCQAFVKQVQSCFDVNGNDVENVDENDAKTVEKADDTATAATTAAGKKVPYRFEKPQLKKAEIFPAKTAPVNQQRVKTTLEKPQLKKVGGLNAVENVAAVAPKKSNNQLQDMMPTLKKVAPGEASPRTQRKRVSSTTEQAPPQKPSAIKAVEKGKKKALVEETPVQQKPMPKVEVSEEPVKATSVAVEEHKPDLKPTSNQSSVEKGTKKEAHTPVPQQKNDLEPVVKKEESKEKRP